MIHKTRAIALHTINYSDNTIIANVYSETHGRLSIMIHGAHGNKKSSGKIVFFQPLSIIDIVFYKKENQTLSVLKEVSQELIFSSIPYDPSKRTIALFIGEIIYKTIKEEVANPLMFQFLFNAIQILDVLKSGISNFHLVFLMQLTRQLGFYPGNTWNESTPFFDLKNGVFTHSEPLHPLFLDQQSSKMVSEVLSTSFENVDTLKLNHLQRNKIINDILSFYQVHLGSVSDIKSLPVLIDVFKD